MPNICTEHENALNVSDRYVRNKNTPCRMENRRHRDDDKRSSYGKPYTPANGQQRFGNYVGDERVLQLVYTAKWNETKLMVIVVVYLNNVVCQTTMAK